MTKTVICDKKPYSASYLRLFKEDEALNEIIDIFTGITRQALYHMLKGCFLRFYLKEAIKEIHERFDRLEDMIEKNKKADTKTTL